MPNMVVLVSNVLPEGGTIRLAFLSWTATGMEAGGDLSIDFNLNASQTHTAVIDAAKAVQTSQNSVTFDPADKIMIFAGRSV